MFRYARDGTGEEGPWKYLAGRTGYVLAVASNIFDRLFNGQVAKAIEVGCWSHARRRLCELVGSDVRVACPLKLIAQLYWVETLADTRGCTPEQRPELRRSRSLAIAGRYQRWSHRMLAGGPPESSLAKGCAYSLNHRGALTRFLEDGRPPLDNKLCELQIRSSRSEDGTTGSRGPMPVASGRRPSIACSGPALCTASTLTPTSSISCATSHPVGPSCVSTSCCLMPGRRLIPIPLPPPDPRPKDTPLSRPGLPDPRMGLPSGYA